MSNQDNEGLLPSASKGSIEAEIKKLSDELLDVVYQMTNMKIRFESISIELKDVEERKLKLIAQLDSLPAISQLQQEYDEQKEIYAAILSRLKNLEDYTKKMTVLKKGLELKKQHEIFLAKKQSDEIKKTLAVKETALHQLKQYIRIKTEELDFIKKEIEELEKKRQKAFIKECHMEKFEKSSNKIAALKREITDAEQQQKKLEENLNKIASEKARLDILKIHSRKMNLTRGINLRKIAEMMPGASGAEVKGVCTEAGMYALRERRVHVTQEDFEMAVAKVMQKDAEKNMSIKKLWK